MFPWVYGFEWNAGYIVFLGLFFTVAVVVVSTLILAFFRTARAQRQGRIPQLAWQASFHDLTPQERACRHALTGELAGRVCPEGFDCRQCAMHASLLEKHAVQGPSLEPVEADVFGMTVPLDRYYHRGHTWARPEADGTFTIGLDEMGRRILGQIDSSRLPAPGAQLLANSPAFTVIRRGADVRILAPIDGTVVEAAPQGHDWFIRVKPEGALNTRHLLTGNEVKAWYLRELERLQLALSTLESAPALADGGTLVEDVSSACPPRLWPSVAGQMFLDA